MVRQGPPGRRRSRSTDDGARPPVSTPPVARLRFGPGSCSSRADSGPAEGSAGEQSAINSPIDELIQRATAVGSNIVINGTYWLGAAAAALLSVGPRNRHGLTHPQVADRGADYEIMKPERGRRRNLARERRGRFRARGTARVRTPCAPEPCENAFDEAVIGMIMLSREMVVLRVNGAACTLLGRDRGELLGQSILDFTHAEDVGPSGRMPQSGRSHGMRSRARRRRDDRGGDGGRSSDGRHDELHHQPPTRERRDPECRGRGRGHAVQYSAGRALADRVHDRRQRARDL
jgi:PAS domain-containing protein